MLLTAFMDDKQMFLLRPTKGPKMASRQEQTLGNAT